MALQVITGNRLADGVSVWFAGAEGWAEHVEQASAYAAPEIEAALAQAMPPDAELEVVDIRPVEVVRENGALMPVAHREQIRARGPSVLSLIHISEPTRPY